MESSRLPFFLSLCSPPCPPIPSAPFRQALLCPALCRSNKHSTAICHHSAARLALYLSIHSSPPKLPACLSVCLPACCLPACLPLPNRPSADDHDNSRVPSPSRPSIAGPQLTTVGACHHHHLPAQNGGSRQPQGVQGDKTAISMPPKPTLTAPQVFNQEFIVDERYNVTKELGQGAYGIVW